MTHYERLAVSNGYALVELHLDTGRTHQIRVHMKYIGCPLPGIFCIIRFLTGSDARPCIPSSWNLLTPSPGSLCVSLHLCLRISAEHFYSKKISCPVRVSCTGS